jgi:hypothetical protein
MHVRHEDARDGQGEGDEDEDGIGDARCEMLEICSFFGSVYRHSPSNGLSWSRRLEPAVENVPVGPARNRMLTTRIKMPENRKRNSAPMKVKSTQLGMVLACS